MGDKLLESSLAEAPLFSFLTFAVFITCISEMLSKEVLTLLIFSMDGYSEDKCISVLCTSDNSFSESFLLFSWVVSSTPTHP